MGDFPIRCFTCGKVISRYITTYIEMLDKGKSKKDILDFLKINRYCCRSVFLGYVNYQNYLLIRSV